jgi:polysaccharide export outer membrane protein
MRTLAQVVTAQGVRNSTQCWGSIALCLVLLPLVGGCGASARSDFDLNRGEGVGPNEQEAEEVFAEEVAGIGGSTGEWRYRIQGGDQLEVVFFTHPEQNRFVKVRPDGFVTLPYVGDVKAENRTPEELATELQERYADVLVSPRVDVLVQEMGARYYVLGEVSRPGEYEYERRIDIMQALAGAGGYDETARLSNIVLLRRGDGTRKSFAAILDIREYMAAEDRSAPLELRPYDIVWVPRSNVSRWDNATEQLLQGVLSSQDAVIQGWSLVHFDEVFRNRGRF